MKLTIGARVKMVKGGDPPCYSSGTLGTYMGTNLKMPPLLVAWDGCTNGADAGFPLTCGSRDGVDRRSLEWVNCDDVVLASSSLPPFPELPTTPFGNSSSEHLDDDDNNNWSSKGRA